MAKRLLMVLWIGACVPATPVGAGINPVPRDAAATCAGYCTQIGLQLSSVVIMASNVGCVCNATSGPPNASVASESAAGGMTAVMLQQEAAAAAARQQDQQRQQQRQQQSH